MAGRIVVVDDEPDIVEAMTALLRDAFPDAVIDGYTSPRAAEEGLAQDARLVITDYKMPESDGIAFLQTAARLRPRAARVLMTAYRDVEIAQRAINDGRIDRLLFKPLDPDKVVEAMTALMDRRQGLTNF